MKKVVIFCTNGYGEFVFNSLDDEIVEVMAFADNDSSKWGEYCLGIEIINPSKIIDVDFDAVIISYAKYAEQIQKQLVSLGVPAEKIIVFQKNEADIQWFDVRVAHMRKCVDTIIERGVTGNIAEVGVYRGDFVRLISRYLFDRKVYLFDTFQGFNSNDIDVNITESQEGLFKKTSVEYVISRMPFPNNCIVRKGYFPETTEGIDDNFCFVSLDADLYNPIKAGLEFFYPRLSHGGYIFVHDFGTRDWPGVKKAVYEFCSVNKVSFFPLLDGALSVVLFK